MNQTTAPAVQYKVTRGPFAGLIFSGRPGDIDGEPCIFNNANCDAFDPEVCELIAPTHAGSIDLRKTTVAQKTLSAINAAFENGKTVFIQTYTRCTEVKAKTAAAWKEAGRELFRMDSAGNLRMAEGKSYVVIAYPSMCLVGVTIR